MKLCLILAGKSELFFICESFDFSELFKAEGDLIDLLEHCNRRGNESWRGTGVDKAIVVLKEKVRKVEYAIDICRNGHLILLEELVKFRNHELGHSVELNLQLEARDGADSADGYCYLINEELIDVRGGSVVSNSDCTCEQDVNHVKLDGKLSGTVESGPELQVCSAFYRDGLRGG